MIEESERYAQRASPSRVVGLVVDRALTKLAVRLPPWKLIVDVQTGAETAYRLDLDPREREPRSSAEVPVELRDALYQELETVEHRELTEEEEATVTKRLADLGYL